MSEQRIISHMSIDGVPFPQVESIDYRETYTTTRREAVEPIGRTEFTVDMSTDFFDEFETWIRSIEREAFKTQRGLGTVLIHGPRGNVSNASLFTLARRGRYGGRKGRRAARRIARGAFGATRGVVEPSILPHILVRST